MGLLIYLGITVFLMIVFFTEYQNEMKGGKR